MAKEEKFPEYKKYRWFITSNKKLVIGGKNSGQNESLIRHFVELKKKYIVMHTKRPGSPFTIILSDNATKKDLEETASFTAAFSHGWKESRKKMMVDVFLLEQMIKKPKMKEGTFGVIETIEHKPAMMELWLTKQNDILRAVPFPVKNAISIIPGKIPKPKLAEQISVKLNIPTEEVLQALPAGKSNIRVKIKKTPKKSKKKKVTKRKVTKK